MGRFSKRLAVLAISLGVAATGPARAETLGDAMASAYETSGVLDQNRALLRAADENVAQAVAALRPIVQWTADVTSNLATASTSTTGFTSRNTSSTAASANISASLLVYDFGRSQLGVDLAKESVLATRFGLISVEQSVLLRAVTAFIEVRRASEFLALRQNNVRLITEELRAARERFEVGEVTRTDVSLAEARIAVAQSGLATARGNLEQARLEYQAAVGHFPRDLDQRRTLPKLPASVDAAIQVAMRNHPDILRAQKDVVVAELNVAIADAALRPSISATARYGVTENLDDSGYNRGASVGVNMTAPIYSGGRLSSLQRQAMQNRDASRANLRVIAERVRQNVGNAYATVLIARSSRQAGEEGVRASRVAFRGVREEATLGARTTLDVLNAEQELLSAQADLISSQVDEVIGAYTLLAAMGKLTAKDCKLRVQLYDAAAYYNLVKTAPAGLSDRGQRLDRVLRRLGNN